MTNVMHLRKDFLPEGQGNSMQEADQVDQRGEEMWVTSSETLGIGLVLLTGSRST
jgi:hypothetical protein